MKREAKPTKRGVAKNKNRRIEGKKLKRAMAKINSRNGNKFVDLTTSEVTQLDQKKSNHFTKRIDGRVKKKFSALVK